MRLFTEEKGKDKGKERTYGVLIEAARGMTSVACGGFALYGAHMELGVGTVLPALVTAAVNLRDVPRIAMVLSAFVIILLGMAGLNTYERAGTRTRRSARAIPHSCATYSLTAPRLKRACFLACHRALPRGDDQAARHVKRIQECLRGERRAWAALRQRERHADDSPLRACGRGLQLCRDAAGRFRVSGGAIYDITDVRSTYV